MKYAVIELNKKQYVIEENSEILVDKVSTVDDLKVLLLVDGDKVQIGQPVLDKVKIDLKITEDVKGKKVTVAKFRAKSRYRKKVGFRPTHTKIAVQKVS